MYKNDLSIKLGSAFLKYNLVEVLNPWHYYSIFFIIIMWIRILTSRGKTFYTGAKPTFPPPMDITLICITSFDLHWFNVQYRSSTYSIIWLRAMSTSKLIWYWDVLYMTASHSRVTCVSLGKSNTIMVYVYYIIICIYTVVSEYWSNLN